MMNQITPQQALIYAMITIAAVDRNISDRELQRIGSIVKDLPVFENFDPDNLVSEAQEAGAQLAKANGLHRVLELITASLPESLYETAYVLSAEVAASDLDIKAEEIRFLELLADSLKLDKLVCSALERSARARHQRA